MEHHFNNKKHKQYEEEVTGQQQRESQIVSMHADENGCCKSSLTPEDIKFCRTIDIPQGRCVYK
jgi:hypothetical protein